MRTLLICHHDAPLNRDGLARWLGSFSTFVGTVVIREPRSRLRRRIAREIERVGWWRFLDVLAFRAFYRLGCARGDREWTSQELRRLQSAFPTRPAVPELEVSSPNNPEAERFMAEHRPDLVIARCKYLLQEQLIGIPRTRPPLPGQPRRQASRCSSLRSRAPRRAACSVWSCGVASPSNIGREPRPWQVSRRATGSRACDRRSAGA